MTAASLAALLGGDLKNFAVASTPGGIEAQEAQGQQTLVNSDILPKDSPWNQLEAMGIKRGKDVDDLFVSVELPEGWKKVATDHSMWSELQDASGKVVASIFYKAAFYDRKAHLSLKQD
jgi:hypothetical protein